MKVNDLSNNTASDTQALALEVVLRGHDYELIRDLFTCSCSVCEDKTRLK